MIRIADCASRPAVLFLPVKLTPPDWRRQTDDRSSVIDRAKLADFVNRRRNAISSTYAPIDTMDYPT